MEKKIYLKDKIGKIIGRNYNDLIALLPCMVCIEVEDSRRSYDVVGFGPGYVILSDERYYEVEPDVGDWSTTRSYDSCIIVPFEKIDETYIFANKPTEKQQEWLDAHDYSGTISGYEAWHIINDAVKKAKKRKKERREEYFSNSWGWDDEEYYGPWNVPNM